MTKYMALIAMGVMLAFAAPGKPVAPSGMWNVDSRSSDVQLSTDGTTDYGKKNTTFTVGFARVGGNVTLDGSDVRNSSLHFDFYPSNSTTPTIDHDGKVNSGWFSNRANNMMICFHSQSIQPTADGRLKVTGTLGMMRVDRNVELTPSESYAGPVYGAPMLHHVQSTATFVFDLPAADGTQHKAKGASFSGSSSLVREDFPPLFRAIIATEWPAVIQEQNCQSANASEAYAGAQCTGTFLIPSFPLGPHATASEDYPGPQNFNTIAGEHLTIRVHMRLTPANPAARASGGN